KDKFGVHHAASCARVKCEEFANFLRFLPRHLFKQLLRGLFGKFGKEVSSVVGSHFLEDIGGLFGVESFHDLRGQALVQFGEDGSGGLLVERGNNALALSGGKLFHHFGEVGGGQILEVLVGDAELAPP